MEAWSLCHCPSHWRAHYSSITEFDSTLGEHLYSIYKSLLHFHNTLAESWIPEHSVGSSIDADLIIKRKKLDFWKLGPLSLETCGRTQALIWKETLLEQVLLFQHIKRTTFLIYFYLQPGFTGCAILLP